MADGDYTMNINIERGVSTNQTAQAASKLHVADLEMHTGCKD